MTMLLFLNSVQPRLTLWCCVLWRTNDCTFHLLSFWELQLAVQSYLILSNTLVHRQNSEGKTIIRCHSRSWSFQCPVVNWNGQLKLYIIDVRFAIKWKCIAPINPGFLKQWNNVSSYSEKINWQKMDNLILNKYTAI